MTILIQHAGEYDGEQTSHEERPVLGGGEVRLWWDVWATTTGSIRLYLTIADPPFLVGGGRRGAIPRRRTIGVLSWTLPGGEVERRTGSIGPTEVALAGRGHGGPWYCFSGAGSVLDSRISGDWSCRGNGPGAGP